ncbi:hypothetical protein AAMO2058_001528900 [Amorphochlora amoebiformis]
MADSAPKWGLGAVVLLALPLLLPSYSGKISHRTSSILALGSYDPLLSFGQDYGSNLGDAKDRRRRRSRSRDSYSQHRHKPRAESRGKFRGRRRQVRRRDLTEEESVKYAFRPDATSAERRAKIAQWNRALSERERTVHKNEERAKGYLEVANYTYQYLIDENQDKFAEMSLHLPGTDSGFTTPDSKADSDDDDDPLGFLLDSDFEGPWIPDRERPPDTGWDVAPNDPAMPLAPRLPGTEAGGIVPTGGNQMNPNTLQSQRLLEHQVGRILVSNLPDTTVDELRTFINQMMAAGQGQDRKPGNSVLQAYYNPIRRYGFVEMRDLDEALQVLDLDGISFKGTPIRVTRPSGYNSDMFDRLRGNRPPPPPLMINSISQTSFSSQTVDQGPPRLHVSGIPSEIEEPYLRQLLEAFGKLKGLYYPRGEAIASNQTTTWALCLYEDTSINQVAIEGLNGLKVMDSSLKVRIAVAGQDFPALQRGPRETLAPEPIKMAPPIALGTASQPPPSTAMDQIGVKQTQDVTAPSVPLKGGVGSAVRENRVSDKPSRVLVLLNMVTKPELEDDEEYAEIMEDVEEESKKFGAVVKVVIPRPGMEIGGVLKVFVEYETVEQAQEALRKLRGRRFGQSVVDGGFWPMEQWKEYELEDLQEDFWPNPPIKPHKDLLEATKPQAGVPIYPSFDVSK